MKIKLNDTTVLFGSNKKPKLLPGGQGNTFKAGNIIIKSADFGSEEKAEIMSNIKNTKKILFPRPLKSKKGNWIENNYVAWTYLNGKESKGRYKEKIKVCDLFNESFKKIKKPRFIEQRIDPWSIADKVTWNELNITYDKEFQQIITPIQKKIKPINLPYQIIHGDIAGNIIFNKNRTPGVIDITLYWRPANYSKALLIVDAITWENASVKIYSLVKDLPKINQLLLRAALRRIIEQFEQVKQFSKSREKALIEVNEYLNTLNKLKIL